MRLETIQTTDRQAMKNIFAILVAVLSWSYAIGQSIPISQGGDVNVNCSDPVVFTDSNDSANGNYAPGESYIITFCPQSGSIGNRLEFSDLPGTNPNQVWDIDDSSYLYVYDGQDTNAPLLLVTNSLDNPQGIVISATQSNTSGCLTFEFVSGDSSSAAGWVGSIGCAQAFQPFTAQINTSPVGTVIDSSTYIDICQGDSVSFDAITDYPYNGGGGTGYAQADSLCNFQWNFGDGTEASGFGLTQTGHVFSNPQGYLVQLTITDSAGYSAFEKVKVRVSTVPNFSGLRLRPDTICFGDTITLSGGILNEDTLGIHPTPGFLAGGGIYGNPTYLPDGTEANYHTTIQISDFQDGQVVTDPSNISSFCINMEHSYVGDLEMTLTCPNGTTITVFNAYDQAVDNQGQEIIPGGCPDATNGNYFGEPLPGTGTGPGVGYTYCFYDDPSLQTICQAGLNLSGNTFPAGDYQVEGSFSDFVGCPLNGNWTLTARDNWHIDDGYIFYWSINFNAAIDPNAEVYTPQIVDAHWLADSASIVANYDTALVVTPSNYGPQAYTFQATDDFGCTHDTTMYMYVYPPINAGSNDDACNNSYILQGTGSLDGDVWSQITGPGTTNFTPIGDGMNTNAAVNALGDYTYQIQDNNCPSYQDTVTISFLPNPRANLISDTILCQNASITLNPGDQLPGDNFSFSWTQDGQPMGQSGQSIDVTETGTYGVAVSGYCGTATDTVNVQAIQYTLQVPPAFCGLSEPISVSVNPPGSGHWIGTDTSMVYSSPNSQATNLIVNSAGTYMVAYVDNRCINDPDSISTTLEEQPTVSITATPPLPPDGKICMDDTLTLTATGTGTFNSQYYWTLNGVSQSSTDPVLHITGDMFNPFTVDSATVLISGTYCPPASTGIQFDGQACKYDVPNIISPNGDGKNDEFTIRNLQYFPNAKLVVFNRWGKKVFEDNNYNQNNNWGAADVSPGTYFYELTLPSIKKKDTGSLTILKK